MKLHARSMLVGGAFVALVAVSIGGVTGDNRNAQDPAGRSAVEIPEPEGRRLTTPSVPLRINGVPLGSERITFTTSYQVPAGYVFLLRGATMQRTSGVPTLPIRMTVSAGGVVFELGRELSQDVQGGIPVPENKVVSIAPQESGWTGYGWGWLLPKRPVQAIDLIGVPRAEDWVVFEGQYSVPTDKVFVLTGACVEPLAPWGQDITFAGDGIGGSLRADDLDSAIALPGGGVPFRNGVGVGGQTGGRRWGWGYLVDA